MPGARHLRGTVASRVRNLLRSGAIKKAWEPVWFPVVEAFPPLLETKVNRKAEAGRMQKIIYPEDKFRKQFHEQFQTNQPLYLWKDTVPSHCDSFVETCMQLVHQGMSDEEAVENAIKTLEFGKKKVAVGMSDDDLEVHDVLNHKDFGADYPPDNKPPELK